MKTRRLSHPGRPLASSLLPVAGFVLSAAGLPFSAPAQFRITEINPSQSSSYDSDPNGASGGRVHHLAATPTDTNVYFAASEWGGLYKSSDKGKTWARLAGHLPVATWDVKVSPIKSNLVIATSFYDGRVDSIAGISVSEDGGATWSHPATAIPPASFCSSAAARDEPSAFGISFDPDSPKDVYVGTNCGLAISNDSGRSWRFVDPTPSDPADAIWSVVVHDRGLIDTCGIDGHRRSSTHASTWTGASGTPLPAGICSIAVSPYEPYVIFATVGPGIFESDDGGASWAVQFTNPIARPSERIPFVKTNRRQAGAFDLWFGDNTLFRASCVTPPTRAPGGTQRCPASSTWVGGFTSSAGAHDDMGDVVFDPGAGSSLRDACPVMMSSDGGVFLNKKSTSPDCQTPIWGQPAVTPHSLWLFGMAGAHGRGGRGESLYLGNQDNGTFASTNAESDSPTWVNPDCCDSFDVTATNTQTLVSLCCFLDNPPDRPDRLFLRGEALVGGAEIKNYPPGKLTGWEAPDIVDRYANNAYVLVTSLGIYITADITQDDIVWKQLGSETTPPNGCAVRAVEKSPPSFYVETGTCDLSAPNAVFRYDGTNATGTWQQIHAPSGATGFGVFTVDRENADRLFASALGDAGPHMVLSTNGGKNWNGLPDLDKLMTGGGKFRYQNRTGPTNFTAFNGYAQPTLAAFSPLDSPTLVAAGADSGVFISLDGGKHWKVVTDNSGRPGNPQVPRAEFAAFDRSGNTSSVFVGTQGRGVWRIDYQ